jgi:hypothetical protein
LFKAGRSVSSFDIAELVEPIRKEREQKRRAQKRQSIIGTLIDEAMLEFTSIDGGGDRKSTAGGGSVVGSLPLEMGGFHTPNDWGEDLGNLGLSRSRAREQAGDAFEIGNLAALEDDPLSGRVRPISSSPPGGADDSDAPPAPRIAPPQQLSSVAPPEPYPTAKNGKGGLVAALVVLVVLAAGAGAYFGGFIPH